MTLKGFNLGFIFFTAVFAVCTMAINNPVSSVTAPQTSGASGLVPSRSRYQIYGNDIVSGTVGGGKEFRGIVPYGSSFYFQGSQSSATGQVQSFMRRSAGTGYATDRRPGTLQQYYSPERTVTSLQPRGGRPGYELPKAETAKAGTDYGLVPLDEAKRMQSGEPSVSTALPAIPPRINYPAARPLNSTPFEREDYLNIEIKSKFVPTSSKTEEEVQKRLEEVKKKLGYVETASEVKSDSTIKPLEPASPETTVKPLQSEALAKIEVKPTEGVFEAMQKQALKDMTENIAKPSSAKELTENKTKETAEESFTGSGSDQNEPLSKKASFGYSSTFAAKQANRFNELMQAAEDFLKQGRFYKAADAYSLASAYETSNPLPYAGKAHALFAAGEYMSSAYFLTRAIEMFPEYLRFHIDLEAMFGEKDIIEKRIVDLKAWQEYTGSGELLFLLGYIYYQTGNLEQAQMAINSALVKMPDSKVLKILDTIVDQAVEEAATQAENR